MFLYNQTSVILCSICYIGFRRTVCCVFCSFLLLSFLTLRKQCSLIAGFCWRNFESHFIRHGIFAFFLVIPDHVLSTDQIIVPSQLMEIASTFGPLRAFRYEVNRDLNEPCAFLEVFLILAIIVFLDNNFFLSLSPTVACTDGICYGLLSY